MWISTESSFVNNSTKVDNFKAKDELPPPPADEKPVLDVEKCGARDTIELARLAANRATAMEAKEARAHLAVCPSCSAAYETFTRLHPGGASIRPEQSGPARR